jgi:D-3-phosphoglycerate dehydrogenase
MQPALAPAAEGRMDWRILIADKLEAAGVERLRSHAEVVESNDLSAIDSYDALIVRGATQVDRAVLAAGRPRLRVVGRSGVGVDNIDTGAAAELGVTVVNAPLATTNAVAEHALALMLALARSIPQADASMKAGAWEKKGMKGTELDGKRLGVIGLGRIGASLAAKAAALGMDVVGHDPPLDPAEILRRGARPVSLDELLSTSDFVSLHVPLDDTTRGLLGPEELAAAKPGLRLISTARGGVVDEEALLAGLETGHIAGAALDVFRREPPGATPLVLHPHVIATPHLGAQTHEAQQRAATDIADEVLAALSGAELRWRIP